MQVDSSNTDLLVGADTTQGLSQQARHPGDSVVRRQGRPGHRVLLALDRHCRAQR